MNLNKQLLLLSTLLLNSQFTFGQTPTNCSNTKIHCVGTNKEFSSIQFALDNSVDGDTVAVFSGLYHESLNINKNHIVLKLANNRQRAKITGEKAVKGWKVVKKYKNGMRLYKAPSPAKNINRLFMKNKELPSSRYPKTGFIEINKILRRDSTNKSKQMFYIPLQKRFKNHFLNDSRMHIRVNPWTIYARRVENTNISNRLSIQLNRPLPSHISFKDKIFFTQVVETIYQVGEWAWKNDYSNPNGVIYLMAREKPTQINAAVRTGITIDNNARNIRIQGLELSKIQGDAISFKSTSAKRRLCHKEDNYQIINNKISYVTGWGIHLFNGCEKGKTTIKNNELHHCRTGALKFRNVGGLLVEKNFIHDIATSSYNDDMLSNGEYGTGTGILIQSCHAGKIRQNKIHNTGYNGIAIINYDAPVSQRLIEYNHVKNAMQGLNDGAGIYFHTKQVKAVRGKDTIQHNIVENCKGSFIGTKKREGYYPQGVGIYLDDYSTNIKVHNNTIIGSAINLFLHDAEKIDLKENLLAKATDQTLYITNRRKDCKSHPLQNTINQNILIAGVKTNHKPLQKIYSFRNYRKDCSIIKNSDNNIIVTTEDPFQEYIDSDKKRNKFSLQMWQQKKGLDTHSQVINQNNLKIDILKNSSLKKQTYLNGKNCHNFQGKTIQNITLQPFKSLVLFGCSKLPLRN